MRFEDFIVPLGLQVRYRPRLVWPMGTLPSKSWSSLLPSLEGAFTYSHLGFLWYELTFFKELARVVNLCGCYTNYGFSIATAHLHVLTGNELHNKTSWKHARLHIWRPCCMVRVLCELRAARKLRHRPWRVSRTQWLYSLKCSSSRRRRRGRMRAALLILSIR